jgi:hypothetical protein
LTAFPAGTPVRRMTLDEAVLEVTRTQSTLPNGVALPHETAP